MSESSPAEAIFFAALERPAHERAAFLDLACTGDAELRARIDKMLAAQPHLGGFLNQPHDGRQTGTYEPTVEVAGAIIVGKYKLLQPIGAGGMGSVWMADQLQPVKRRVAVKLIRSERGSSQAILARFEAERQAIALMDHPHIARLLDAGTIPGVRDQESGASRQGSGGKTQDAGEGHLTPDPRLLTPDLGRPYFVMELVKGVPLNKFCDENRLSITQRLELFMQICAAVQHAHQKGIIHRDLKPTNVLVEAHDDRPVAKVIDFGLAKALSGQPLTEHTLFTGFGTVAGTPLYMAPEQAKFNAIDIDTRADIYALGVILYELLTGTTPIERDQLKKAAIDEILRVIRESEPPTPSKRLSSSDSKPTVASNRQMEPMKLSRFLRGDLDWIVMKALAKERDRRYETASGFAKDIERFLNHEPVTAGPPTAAYRLRKFVRRNRPQVIAGSLLLLALLAGIAGTTLGLIHAQAAWQAEAERAEGERLAKLEAEAAATAERVAKQEAEKSADAERHAKQNALAAAEAAKASAEAAKTANARAQVSLQQVKKGTEILASVFKDLNPTAEEKEGVSLRVQLGRRLGAAVKQLEGESVGDELEVARLQGHLAVALMALGHYDQAEDALVKAVRTNAAILGADHPFTLLGKGNLATLYHKQGKLAQAEKLDREVLAVRIVRLGENHPDTLICKSNLAVVYQARGKYAQAETLYQELLEAWTTVHGPEHRETIAPRQNLAALYDARGKYAQAEALYKEALAVSTTTRGANDAATLQVKSNLATLYATQGKYAQAETLYREVLASKTMRFGADHPETLGTKMRIAMLYLDLAKDAQAEILLQEVIAGFTATLKADHPDTLIARHSLAKLYVSQGKDTQAETLLQEVLQAQSRALGADHPHTLTTKQDLATVYRSRRTFIQAESLFRQVLDTQTAKLGSDHPDTLATKLQLATLYQDLGKYAQAEALHNEVLKGFTAVLQPDHPKILATQSNLARLFDSQGRYAEAAKLYQHVVQASTKALGREHPSTTTAKVGLGVVWHHLGKYPQAEALYREALEVRSARLAADHPSILTAKNNLADLYRAQRKYAAGEVLYKEVLQAETARLGADHPDTLHTKNNLAALYQSAGKHAQAETLYKEALQGQTAKLGADHPRTLASMNNLAALYWKMKRLDRSVPLFEEAYKLRRKKLGAGHPDTLMTLANLGVNYRDAGRLEDGIRCLKDSLDGARKSPGPLPAKLNWVAGELAATLDGARRYAQSESLYREFLQQGRRQYGDADPRTAGLMAYLGHNLLAQQKHAEAEGVLRECVAIRDQREPDAWTTFNTRSLLGGALLGQNKYAEAEALLLAGYEGMSTREGTIPVQGRSRVTEALERLVQLNEATGKETETKRWRKALQSREQLLAAVHDVGKDLELKGKLDAPCRTIIYQVKLLAGKTYVIDMESPDQKALDPYLILTDAAGKTLAHDDDGGAGLNARIVYSVMGDDIFRVRATSVNAGTGDFRLRIREQVQPAKEQGQ
jgi:eukaryotic-like serine/threonine-protein kinase